ncbi:MAG: orotate phosphoribosyltransferase [Alphaproteobacteria bacterium]|jgi:orotate phosphoribosyltransferase|nr:orotate phosphoribosyltransferase [Alphaproteobacteria bacterium]
MADKKKIARETARILLETKSVLLNAREPFTYTSGRKGPCYADCRRLISFPRERETLMDFAVQILEQEIGAKNIDYIAGGETAGIPYAAFLSQKMQKPMLYIRKKPKGFGRMAQIEGHMEDEGKKILLIEDVQNFGTSVKIFIDALRAANAVIEHLLVIFSHGHESSAKNMQDMDVKLHALCTWRDVLDAAREDGYFDSETLASVESFLNDPEGWDKNKSSTVSSS